MKVCEWDDVSCPYCGESREHRGNSAFGLKELAPVSVHSSEISLPAHHLLCLSCAGEFFIPCGD